MSWKTYLWVNISLDKKFPFGTTDRRAFTITTIVHAPNYEYAVYLAKNQTYSSVRNMRPDIKQYVSEQLDNHTPLVWFEEDGSYTVTLTPSGEEEI